MTMTLSSATAANAYPSAAAAPAPKTAVIANLAVSLSNDSSLIASISGASSAGTSVYNAQGLMNNYLQAAAQDLAASSGAGASSADTSTSTSQTTGQTTGTAAATQSGDGATAANTDPAAFNGTPDWANVLKANPSMSGVFLADSTNQLLVNQLSVFA